MFYPALDEIKVVPNHSQPCTDPRLFVPHFCTCGRCPKSAHTRFSSFAHPVGSSPSTAGQYSDLFPQDERAAPFHDYSNHPLANDSAAQATQQSQYANALLPHPAYYPASGSGITVDEAFPTIYSSSSSSSGLPRSTAYSSSIDSSVTLGSTDTWPESSKASTPSYIPSSSGSESSIAMLLRHYATSESSISVGKTEDSSAGSEITVRGPPDAASPTASVGTLSPMVRSSCLLDKWSAY